MTARAAAFTCVTLLLSIGGAAAARQSRESASAARAGTASISGRVVGADAAHAPIRRAIVTLTGEGLETGRSAITDDDGLFQFARMPAGRFSMTAARPAFLPAAYGASRPGRAGTPLTLSAGQAIADLTIPMTHGAAIAGTVRDIVGDAAPGMRVEAIRLQTGGAGNRAAMVAAAITDDHGEYRIFGLPPGDYVVSVTARMLVGGMGDIGVPSESEVDALLSSLQRKSSASPGSPLTPPSAPGTSGRGSTPAAPPQPKSSSFMPTFFPGVVQPGEAAHITLAAGDERLGADVSLRMAHAASIDGSIVAAKGGTVPPVQIAIRPIGPEIPTYGGSNGASISMRLNDHTFHISNVTPGRYRVTGRTFGAPGGSGNVISAGALPAPTAPQPVLWAIADVDVASDDLSGLTLTLQPALRVTGRLTWDSQTGSAGDAGTLRAALVPVVDPDLGSNGVTGPLPAVIHRDGTFEVAGVVPGTYKLTVDAPAGWWLRSAMVGGTPATGRDALDGGLVVGASDVAGVVVTLSNRHSSLGGTLTIASGAAATDYFMVAFPTDRSLWHAPARRVVSTRPANDGGFVLADLPAGTYYLAAVTDIEPADLEDLTFLELMAPSAVTVTVADGQRTVQNLRVAGRGR